MAGWVVAAAAVPGVLGLVVAAVVWGKLRRVRRDQRVLLPDGTAGSLIDRQAGLSLGLDGLRQDLARLGGESARISARVEEALATSVRYQGLVRYNAFGDIGGNQSWSLALLNARHTGAVLTLLHSREETRMYVKELRTGVPDRELSDEEQRAVAAAIAGGAA